MRRLFKTLIFAMIAVIVAEGVYLSVLLRDTWTLTRKDIPAMDDLGRRILKDLEFYRQEKRRLMARYPVAEPRNWLKLMNDTIKAKGVKVNRSSKTQEKPIRGVEARTIVFSFELAAEDKGKLIAAAAGMEKLSPAVVVTSLNILPRRSKDAPFVCSLEVTVYESTAAATPEASPAPSPSPSAAPSVVPSPPPAATPRPAPAKKKPKGA